MRSTFVAGEPEIDGSAVIVRVVVEDPALEDTGGIFVCRMTGYDAVSVERFPVGATASADGELRVEAADAAVRYALENRDQFDALFARLEQ